jgi:hypothetical protein
MKMAKAMAEAQKKSLSFLRLDENQECSENNCDICYRQTAEIIKEDPFEFILKCEKNSQGQGGCSWKSCNKCIKSWYENSLKSIGYSYGNSGFQCPQCKASKTFEVNFNEIYEKVFPKPKVSKNMENLYQLSGINFIDNFNYNIPNYNYIPKSQDPNYILNPKTKHYVKKTGAIGKKILKEQNIVQESSKNVKTKKSKNVKQKTSLIEKPKLTGLKPKKLIYNDDKTKIKNPETNRWCKVDGNIGTKVIKNYKNEKKAYKAHKKPKNLVDEVFD